MTVDPSKLENPDLSVDMLPDSTLVAHAETGCIVDVNQATGDMFNCDPDYLIGMNQWELHPEGEEDLYREAFERGIRGDRVDRLENGEPVYIKTVDGNLMPVEINVNVVESSGEKFVIGVFRNTTNQIEREKKLKSTKSRLQTLLDALPVPVAIVDSNGYITRWNEQASETFGYNSESVIGEKYSLFPDNQEFEELLSRSVDGESFDGYRTTIRAKDGSRVPVELYARPIYEDGELTSILGVSVDVSDEQQRKRQLNVLQRVLRHNLRNKMTVIQGWTEQMKNEGCTQRSISNISEASRSLIELTDQVNDIRRAINEEEAENKPASTIKLESDLDVQNIDIEYSDDSKDVNIPERGLQSVKSLIECSSGSLDNEKVDVSIRQKDKYVFISLQSNDSLLSENELSYLRKGTESPLKHTDDLQMAYIYILLKSVGGDITVSDDTTILIELPRMNMKTAVSSQYQVNQDDD